MNLIYEGIDITNEVQIHRAEFIDTAGGKADSIEICFSDVSGNWSKWEPKKNDKVIISHDGLSSGTMYVDELEQQRGMFIIRALSVPQIAKTQNTKSWESIRFLEFAADIATRYGFAIESYGVENYLYTRVEQFQEADFQFLLYRCILEGYMLKITDNKVIIYNETYLKKNGINKSINVEDFDGNYRFKNKSNEIYSECEINCNGVNTSYKPIKAPYGPTLKYSDIYVNSSLEATRFAKNLLINKNKFEVTGTFTIKLDTSIASGTYLNIYGVGLDKDNYFCYETKHDFVGKKTSIKVRSILEDY